MGPEESSLIKNPLSAVAKGSICAFVNGLLCDGVSCIVPHPLKSILPLACTANLTYQKLIAEN